MSVVEFLMQNYVIILVLLGIAIVTVIGFLADKKGKVKKSQKKDKQETVNPIENNANSGQPSVAPTPIPTGGVQPQVINNQNNLTPNNEPVPNSGNSQMEPVNNELLNSIAVGASQPSPIPAQQAPVNPIPAMDFSNLTNNNNNPEEGNDQYRPLSEQKPSVAPRNVDLPTNNNPVNNVPSNNSFDSLLNVSPIENQPPVMMPNNPMPNNPNWGTNPTSEANPNILNQTTPVVPITPIPPTNNSNINQPINTPNPMPSAVNSWDNQTNTPNFATAVSENQSSMNPTPIPEPMPNPVPSPTVVPNMMPNNQVPNNSQPSMGTPIMGNATVIPNNINVQPQVNNNPTNVNPTINNNNQDLWRL